MAPRLIEIDKVNVVETQRLLRACLTLAVLLGDLIEETVIVGGLVPSLLIDQSSSVSGFEPHAGTKDIDIGLSLALFDDQRYDTIANRLREHGLENDRNDNGQPAHQRWLDPHGHVLVEFLIPPSDNVTAGQIKHLSHEFGAFVVPGLIYAFNDSEHVQLVGLNSRGAEANRIVRICGPASFIILKSLAFRNRAKNKDAYDIVYFLKYFPDSQLIARLLNQWKQEEIASQALSFLQEDFASPQATGPIAYSRHVSSELSPEIQADAFAVVHTLLDHI